MIRYCIAVTIFLFSSSVFAETLTCNFVANWGQTNLMETKTVSYARIDELGKGKFLWQLNKSLRKYEFSINWLKSYSKYSLQMDEIKTDASGNEYAVGLFQGDIALIRGHEYTSGTIFLGPFGAEKIGWRCTEAP